MKTFRLPDLGEGLPDAEIHQWHVSVGQTVKTDDPLVSMETAKAVVDVPAPCDGLIKELHGKVGDLINTGDPLVSFESNEQDPEPEKKAIPASGATVAGNIIVGDTVLEENAMGVLPSHSTGSQIKALPVVRLIAQKLNLDLTKIKANGQQGEISLDDVLRLISTELQAAPNPRTPTKSETPIGYEALRGVRRAMAQAMAISHQEVAAVTIVDDADLSNWPKGSDISARIIRAIAYACREEPALNGYFDGKSNSRRLSPELHLGLAMDSGDGLFVPVIKQAESLEPSEIRALINRYKEEVRDRSIPTEDLQGATLSFSNFGVFAGRYANPMIVPPMIAIIGSGKLREEAKFIDGVCQARRVLPLSLTFDHRAATGGEASRFLAAMIEDLQRRK